VNNASFQSLPPHFLLDTVQVRHPRKSPTAMPTPQ
jgi:hypothetical protein